MVILFYCNKGLLKFRTLKVLKYKNKPTGIEPISPLPQRGILPVKLWLVEKTFLSIKILCASFKFVGTTQKKKQYTKYMEQRKQTKY